MRDNGPGIPTAERERVFERFYRILGNGAESSALGLSIAKEIVEAVAAGSISAMALDRGLVVTVRLRLASAVAEK